MLLSITYLARIRVKFIETHRRIVRTNTHFPWCDRRRNHYPGHWFSCTEKQTESIDKKRLNNGKDHESEENDK